MALLVGVNVDRVISATFIIGSALAAIGGVLIASRIGQINFASASWPASRPSPPPCSAASATSRARCSAVWSSVSTESFGTGYISSAYEDVFAFGLLVLILILRPAGLLGKAVKQKV